VNGVSVFFWSAAIAFASYRVWALIALDEITRKIRLRVFDETKRFPIFRKWLKLWWMCPWCAGSWITFGLTAAVNFCVDGGIPAPVLVALAAAAGTALLGGNDERLMTAESEVD
jgi:hypothetical protein